MSGERTLVVHQSTMENIETSLRDATSNINDYITQLTGAVDAQTAGWTEGTPSRIAQRAREQKLKDAVTALAAALGKIADEVDSHREKCHDMELQNVAIVG